MSVGCAEVRFRLEALVDGEPALEEAARLRAHLRTCAGCRAEYDLAASLPSRLRALTAPPPPPELLSGVLSAVRGERRRARLNPLLGAGEVLLVAIALWYLSGLQGLAALGGRIAGEAGQLVGWSAGTASLPAPAAGDLFLLLLSLALAAICALHLSLLSEPGQPGRRA